MVNWWCRCSQRGRMNTPFTVYRTITPGVQWTLMCDCVPVPAYIGICLIEHRCRCVCVAFAVRGIFRCHTLPRSRSHECGTRSASVCVFLWRSYIYCRNRCDNGDLADTYSGRSRLAGTDPWRPDARRSCAPADRCRTRADRVCTAPPAAHWRRTCSGRSPAWRTSSTDGTSMFVCK